MKNTQWTLSGSALACSSFSENIWRPLNFKKENLLQVQDNRNFLEQCMRSNQKVYGLNTGFGALANKAIDQKDLEQHQLNLIRSHAVGTGPYLPKSVARGLCILRLNSFLRAHSGVRPELLTFMMEMLNKNFMPAINSYGSVGASGDLSPLAQLALGIIGEGMCFDEQGELIGTKKWLLDNGLSPIRLKPKEGLALINGTSLMNAWGMIAYSSFCRLWKWAIAIGCLNFEALCAHPSPFAHRVNMIRQCIAQEETASTIRQILHESQWIGSNYPEDRSPQDSYTVRCAPQVWGAILESARHTANILSLESAAVTDNPLVFHDNPGQILSGGNFHGQRVAFSLAQLKLALSELGNFAERGIAKLVDPALNHGLPAFLSTKAGHQSGLMIVQYAAAERVVDARLHTTPAAADSIPTCAGTEDHVSMGPVDARTLWHISHQVNSILAGAALCAAQALDLRGREASLRTKKRAPLVNSIHEMIRERVAFLEDDRNVQPDLITLEKMIDTEDPPLPPHIFPSMDSTHLNKPS